LKIFVDVRLTLFTQALIVKSIQFELHLLKEKYIHVRFFNRFQT